MSSSRHGYQIPSEQGGDLLSGLQTNGRPNQMSTMEPAMFMQRREPSVSGLSTQMATFRHPTDRETRHPHQLQSQCPISHMRMEPNYAQTYTSQMERMDAFHESAATSRVPAHLTRGVESMNGHPGFHSSNRTMLGSDLRYNRTATGVLESGIRSTATPPILTGARDWQQQQQQRQSQLQSAGRLPPSIHPTAHPLVSDYPQIDSPMHDIHHHRNPTRSNFHQSGQGARQRSSAYTGNLMNSNMQLRMFNGQQQNQSGSLIDRRNAVNPTPQPPPMPPPQRIDSLTERRENARAEQNRRNQHQELARAMNSNQPPIAHRRQLNRKLTQRNSAPQYTTDRRTQQSMQNTLKLYGSTPQPRRDLGNIPRQGRTMFAPKSSLDLLIQQTFEAFRMCEGLYLRNRNLTVRDLTQRLHSCLQYFVYFTKQQTFNEEDTLMFTKFKNEATRLIEHSKTLKEQQDSPQSNTSVVNNNQFMETEGAGFLTPQDSPLPPEVVPQIVQEESRLSTRAPGEVDISPAESSNRHQGGGGGGGLNKDHNGDDMIDLYTSDDLEKLNRSKEEPLGYALSTQSPKTDSKMVQGLPLSSTGELELLMRTTNAANGGQRAQSRMTGDLRGQERGTPRDARRKRVPLQECAVSNERGNSRRKMDPTNLLPLMETSQLDSPLPFPTGVSQDGNEMKTKQQQQQEEEVIEEDRGSTDGLKEIKKSVDEGDEEGLEVEELLQHIENKGDSLPWFGGNNSTSTGLDYDNETIPEQQGKEEWKFDRTVLVSLSSSVPVHRSEISATNKAFFTGCQEAQNEARNLNEIRRIEDEENRTSETEDDMKRSLTLLQRRVQTECNQLLEALDQSETTVYQTSILDQYSKQKYDRNEQEAALVLECKYSSKVSCDIRLLIDANYPDSVPNISFTSSSAASPLLRSSFLSQITDRELTSITEILQLWTEQLATVSGAIS
eukprot:g4120.t1